MMVMVAAKTVMVTMTMVMPRTTVMMVVVLMMRSSKAVIHKCRLNYTVNRMAIFSFKTGIS